MTAIFSTPGAMPKVLQDITIHEVSAVDRGAGEGVRVLLMKRHNGAKDTSTEHSAMPIDKKHEDFLACLVAKADKKAAKKAARKELEKSFLPSEAEFYKTLSGSDQKAFRKMTVIERAEVVKAGKLPPKKKPADDDADDDDANKALAKRIESTANDVLAKALKANEDLQKRLEQVEKDGRLAIAKAECGDLGIPDTEAETVMKARDGDKAAVAKLTELMKQVRAQRDEAVRTGGIFKEIGGAGSNVKKTALDELNALAVEMRKADPKLTEAQAFDKVMSDPANREIVARERSEHLAKIQKVAA